MRRRVPSVLLLSSLLIAAVLTAAKAGGRQGADPAAPVTPGAAGMSVPVPEPAKAPPPLAPGPAPDLDLVFTSHVIGWIEPCG